MPGPPIDLPQQAQSDPWAGRIVEQEERWRKYRQAGTTALTLPEWLGETLLIKAGVELEMAGQAAVYRRRNGNGPPA